MRLLYLHQRLLAGEPLGKGRTARFIHFGQMCHDRRFNLLQGLACLLFLRCHVIDPRFLLLPVIMQPTCVKLLKMPVHLVAPDARPSVQSENGSRPLQVPCYDSPPCALMAALHTLNSVASDNEPASLGEPGCSVLLFAPTDGHHTQRCRSQPRGKPGAAAIVAIPGGT